MGRNVNHIDVVRQAGSAAERTWVTGGLRCNRSSTSSPRGSEPIITTTSDRHGRHRRTPPDAQRRPPDGYRALGASRFERLVEDAIATLPKGLLAHLDNVQITVADVPPADPDHGEDEILLGLYQGVPRTERDLDAPVLPDRITLFRRPIELRARSKEELAEVVRETVVHEIAHHFGIDDDRLDELGWG
jgi:predicted Zn-dependent protease with MMP-like domain